MTQNRFRFAVTASMGVQTAKERGQRFEAYLTRALGKLTEVSVAPNYEEVGKELLDGRIDAAWAPPFVCARVEAMGLRVLVRGVRRGSHTFRAALVTRAGSPLTLESLPTAGARVAWTDRDSTAGYLLPVAFLKAKKLDPAKVFSAQDFTGSYRASLEAVLEGRAQLAGTFAPSADTGASFVDDAELVVPGRARELQLVAYTDEAPNDGVVVSSRLAPETVSALEHALTALHQSPEGKALLAEAFRVERFEVAPKMGYRALYRLALQAL